MASTTTSSSSSDKSPVADVPMLFQNMTPEQREAVLQQADNFMGVAQRFALLICAIGKNAGCTPKPLDLLVQNTSNAYSAWTLARHMPALVDPFATLTHLWAGMGQANMMRTVSISNLGLDGAEKLVEDLHRFTGYLLDRHTHLDTAGFEEQDLTLIYRYMCGIEGFIKYFASKVMPEISDLVDMSPVNNTLRSVGQAYQVAKQTNQFVCTPDSLRMVIDLCDKYAAALGLEQPAPAAEQPAATPDPGSAPSDDSSS